MFKHAQRRTTTLGLALVLATLCVGAFGQSISVPRPEVKAGDKWKVERRDARTKLAQGASETVVVGVSGDRVELLVNGSPGAMTPELTLLDGPRMTYDNGYQFLRFPLEDGKKWAFKTKWHNKQSGGKGWSELDAEVKGQERIKVAAGEFDVYKLEARGYMNFDAGGSRRVSVTYWYAPQAKAIVRLEWVDRSDDFVNELLSYSLAP